MFATGWLYPVLLSIGAIVICTAMELLSIAVSDRAARKIAYSGPGFTGEGRQKAA